MGNQSIVMESRCLAPWQSKTPSIGRVIRPRGRGTGNHPSEEEPGNWVEGPESGYMRWGGMC